MIYVDSLVFIFATAILEHGLGLNSNMSVCGAAILLCLACYLSTKLLIYYFLVEKVVRAIAAISNYFLTNNSKYVVRAVSTPRLKSKLWCFNVFGLLCMYLLLSLSDRTLTNFSVLLCGCCPQFRFSYRLLQRRRYLHYRHGI